MADIFISYSREDQPKARRLARLLECHRWSLWWDKNLVAGKDFEAEIRNQIKAAKCTIVIWSKDAVKSTWVKDEANLALKLSRMLPIHLDESDLPLGFGGIHVENFAHWRGNPDDECFCRLLDAIYEFVGKPEPVTEALENEVLSPFDGWKDVKFLMSEDDYAYLTTLLDLADTLINVPDICCFASWSTVDSFTENYWYGIEDQYQRECKRLAELIRMGADGSLYLTDLPNQADAIIEPLLKLPSVDTHGCREVLGRIYNAQRVLNNPEAIKAQERLVKYQEVLALRFGSPLALVQPPSKKGTFSRFLNLLRGK